jgi:methylated-DNA-[protein]-cysteine S-methyltransferase
MMPCGGGDLAIPPGRPETWNDEGMSAVATTVASTPIGDILLTAEDDALTGLFMSPHEGGPARHAEHGPDSRPLAEAKEQLAAYFAGQLCTFDLPLALRGTDFQLRVWRELAKIPFGTTISYRQLAERVGNAKASRAVGLANGRNPISIIVPCHRVIGSSGQLVGYGGGIDRKRYLLAHEGVQLAV